MQTERKPLEEIAELLEVKYGEVYNEITNTRTFATRFSLANLMEINKPDLDQRIESLISLLRSVKKIKEFK